MLTRSVVARTRAPGAPTVLRERRRRARCVPDRPVNTGNPPVTHGYLHTPADLRMTDPGPQHRRLRPRKQLIMLPRHFRSSVRASGRLHRIVIRLRSGIKGERGGTQDPCPIGPSSGVSHGHQGCGPQGGPPCITSRMIHTIAARMTNST